MSYINGVADAVKSAPNPASPSLGPIPKGQLPPPPSGVGAMPTGSPTRTKQTVGGEAIAALRDLQGYAPELFNDVNDFIARIKNATKPQANENPGPPLGEPGVPGAAQLDASPELDSGSPGGV
jgi:hypothetical protein